MKKTLVFVALVVGMAALAKLFGPKMQNVDWGKKFERMPDNAPPKWMFRNITAIRENTDRILELAERGEFKVDRARNRHHLSTPSAELRTRHRPAYGKDQGDVLRPALEC